MAHIKSPEHYDQIVSINVDIQNDFCPGGSLAVAEGDAVVEPMNEVNQFVRDLGGIVIFTRDWHPRVTNHFTTEGGPWPPHCIAYQAGAAFHDDLVVDTLKRDLVASKGTRPNTDDYSGTMAVMDNYTSYAGRGETFHPSVSQYITREIRNKSVRESWGSRNMNIESFAVVIGGLATDYCVKATVLDLAELRNSKPHLATMGLYVVENAIRAVDVTKGDGDTAIAEMKNAGAIFITSADLVAGSVVEV